MELTEREKVLLEIIKKMINFMTVWGIHETKIHDLAVWRSDALHSMGLNLEWQDEMLKTLERDFDVKYTKLDDNGKPKEDNG